MRSCSSGMTASSREGGARGRAVINVRLEINAPTQHLPSTNEPPHTSVAFANTGTSTGPVANILGLSQSEASCCSSTSTRGGAPTPPPSPPPPSPPSPPPSSLPRLQSVPRSPHACQAEGGQWW